jgi:hypothetical protein
MVSDKFVKYCQLLQLQRPMCKYNDCEQLSTVTAKCTIMTVILIPNGVYNILIDPMISSTRRQYFTMLHGTIYVQEWK